MGGTSGAPVPSSEDPTDLDLLHAHVAGDRDAFAELFRRHRDRLWAVALRTVGDREEAADALQDALLSAHRAAGRFRGDSAVTTWLHRIVVNACLDRIRRRQTHRTVPLPDGVHDAASGSATGGVEPAAPAPDHDTALVVRDALAALPVEQRAALILVDVQGYRVSEAALILGVAEGTVKSRCARGRARLARSLGHLRPRSAPDREGPTGAVTTEATVPAVTPGNPQPSGNVGSGSGRSRRDARQEDA
ncbi:RNA polymerase sigma factor SigM [Micromonospora sp. NPDC049799]|uniref:RNA polymerase sigma factor SigM n=1 Tax=Micromonospora sp. NPDC049799 TaxID=3154741 RepID=UPI0033FF18BA